MDLEETIARENALIARCNRDTDVATALFSGLRSQIFVVRSDRTVEQVNGAVRLLLGWSDNELAGQDLLTLFPDSEQEAVGNLFHDVLTKGERATSDGHLIAKDNSSLTCLFSWSPIISQKRPPEGLVLVATDRQEMVYLEEALVRSQKLEAIGQLAAGVAHEINTPMQYIGDNLEFLGSGLSDVMTFIKKVGELLSSDPEKHAVYRQLAEEIDLSYLLDEGPKALQQTKDGVMNVTRIVRSLKSFAHPGKESMDPHDLRSVIEDTVAVGKNEWKYVAEVVTDFDERLGPVPCILGEVSQVVLNLLINAAHAVGEAVQERGEEKGRIRIATYREGCHACVEIEDNGTGIPEEIRDRVFDPFFTTKDVGIGTGQGLAMAHKVIVDKHRGRIDLHSQPGCTRFVLRLPLQQS